VRVALVVQQVRPEGGQDRYALELARQLASRCDLDVVAIRVEGSLPSTVGIRRITLPRRPALLINPIFRRLAAAIAARGRYDVVHSIGAAMSGANVVTAQFCNAAWRAIVRDPGLYRRTVISQAIAGERITYRHPNLRAVIAVSRRTGSDLEHHYGPLRAPVIVIPNAVDHEQFRPPEREAPRSSPPRVLFVGAYHRKGLDIAIRSLSLMAVRAELVAIGSGDRRALSALAASLGVGDRVHLEPPRSHIADAFRSADVFVFPTRYEPFGMVIAEALASGVPVITSARAGAAELIQEGESGFVLADPEDVEGFARAADLVLCADASTRARRSLAAREAVRLLTWERIAERTFEVYHRVAKH